MLIFWKERLVFLSTPKTGTTAIETALESIAHVPIRRPPELKHLSASRYRRYMGPLLEKAAGDSFTVVALMREPIDWVGSWYRYRQRPDLGDNERSTIGLSFEQAVEGYLSDPPAPSMTIGSQSRFLCGPANAPLVDRLFAYERMDEFVAFLEDRLDFEIHLPRVNVSPESELDLTAGMRRRLEKHLADDYALYRAIS